MSSSKANRPGAIRKKNRGKTSGSGGKGRRALEGKGPTPKAEDRPYHPKAKAKQAKLAQQQARPKQYVKQRGSVSDHELVTGRNSVLEALRTKTPATALYIAAKTEIDDRVRESIGLATGRDIPVLEIMRQEMDRMTSRDTVHQGILLKVPPYEYAHPEDLLERALGTQQPPLLVALDGVTDPRNLGAIVRSVAAFGGHGVILPQRRSASMNAAAWKTSAGAAARLPVAMASNLTSTIKALKKQGVFVIGLDGGGDTPLPGLALADQPLLVVTGSEGDGLSRLVREHCDAIVSIPISRATESLNAGIATSVALYEISKLRASHDSGLEDR